MKFLCLGVLGFLAACGITPASQSSELLSAKVAAESQVSLCAAYQNPTTTPVEKLMIEAELGLREVKQCSGANYGAATAASLGTQRYSRSAGASQRVSNDLRNCNDFSSGAAAQKFFLATGGPINDPHNLDKDGDGLACEWGAQVTRISTYRAPIATPVRRSPKKTTVSRRSTASSRCHVGPRGGRYTISSSGRKVYNC